MAQEGLGGGQTQYRLIKCLTKILSGFLKNTSLYGRNMLNNMITTSKDWPCEASKTYDLRP